MSKNKFKIKYNDKTPPLYDKYFKKNYIGFRTDNSILFKNIATFITNIAEQINFKLNENGIEITTMDSSHIALINCLLPKSLFKTFQINKENNEDEEEDEIEKRQIIWGINMPHFIKILNQIKRNDELIVYQNKNMDYINITLRNEKYDKYYSLKLMNIDSDELCITDIPDTTHLEMDSRYFNDIIKDFNDLGETLKIKICENDESIDNDSDTIGEDELDICFECEGELTCLQMVIHKNDIVWENLQLLESEYSISNINTFSKGYNLSEQIRIEIGDGVPLKFIYKIQETGYINYYLAPKITDN